MSRGAILFAFNSPRYDYYKMAEYTAKRINHFLDLPVTIVTDKESLKSKSKYKFDNVVTVNPDTSNTREGFTWINKGRYQAYELSPYDETLLLDVDYMVNSDRCNKIFDTMYDFACHDTTAYYFNVHQNQELLHPNSHQTCWATVVGFRRSNRVEQIFDCMKMIQDNYRHYAHIHGYLPKVFRNDFALTLALRIVNGHTYLPGDIIPWSLLHVSKNVAVHANNNKKFNTEFTLLYDKWFKSKIKKEYITIKNTDFHTINKDIFVELINE